MRKLLEAERREEGGSRCTERCDEGPGWELNTQEPTLSYHLETGMVSDPWDGEDK